MINSSNNPSQAPRVDFSNQLLVAMPGMVGGSLADTVIYVCEHNEQGALGVVINRPTDLTLGDLLQRIDLELSLEIGVRQSAPVFFGGPVQTDRGFVLHTPVGDYSSSISMGAGVALTTSRDVLQEVAVQTSCWLPWVMQVGQQGSSKRKWRTVFGCMWTRI